jgi:hypothetical protein
MFASQPLEPDLVHTSVGKWLVMILLFIVISRDRYIKTASYDGEAVFFVGEKGGKMERGGSIFRFKTPSKLQKR